MLNSDTAGTKNRVLDSAEVIYATEGIEGLSLRTIAERANANLAAINYHFRTKSALTEAMLTRALGPLTSESDDLLDCLQAHYKNDLHPTHVLAAVLLPVIRELGEPHVVPHRLQFLQRTTTDQSPFVRQLMSNAFASHAERFDKAFVQSFPAKSAVDAVLYFRLFCNALSGSLCNHNTFAICQILVARPGTTPRDILLFFANMLARCATSPCGDKVDPDLNASVDDVMRVLASSHTARMLTVQSSSTHQEA
jgi:AcrR family transcriptional regulator